MKNDLRAQSILLKFIKYFVIPYAVKLETPKEIYDRLEKLFSESTIGKFISLRSYLYKLEAPKDEGIYT